MHVAVFTTLERVHHYHPHFLAVLALVSSFPAFFAAARLAFGSAAMTLATARTILGMLRLALAAPLGQLRRGRRRRTFTIHFNDQHFTIVARCLQLSHERCRLAPHAKHYLFDRLGCRRPRQHRLAHHL